MESDGTCPRCGGSPEVFGINGKPLLTTPKDLDLRALAGDEDVSLPWHFKLLVVLLIAYLGWRVVALFM